MTHDDVPARTADDAEAARLQPGPAARREAAAPVAHVRLALDGSPHGDDPDPAHDISAAARIGDTLFLGADECAEVEVLHLGEDGFGEHRRIELGEAFDLPGGSDEEMDIEGLAVEGEWLWVVGSHSRTRKKPKPEQPLDAAALDRLAALKLHDNRMFLGRLPLVETSPGRWDLAPKGGSSGRRPQMLPVGKNGGALYKRLKKHPLIGPFCALPAKENGLDVEGIVVEGDRVGLGLRGPVVGGWAMLLEAKVAARGGKLKLDGALKTYVLDLDGLGVRDLKRVGDDVLILAGPTMKLDGPCRIYRWRGWTDPVLGAAEQLHRPEPIIELPYGHDCDHPEALAPTRDGEADALLVVCDKPAPGRQGDGAVTADVFRLPA